MAAHFVQFHHADFDSLDSILRRELQNTKMQPRADDERALKNTVCLQCFFQLDAAVVAAPSCFCPFCNHATTPFTFQFWQHEHIHWLHFASRLRTLPTIDIHKTEKKYKPKTKAVVLVHVTQGYLVVVVEMSSATNETLIISDNNYWVDSISPKSSFSWVRSSSTTIIRSN